MPSSAYNTFRTKLLKDVDSLIETHSRMKTGNRGRQHQGHLTRSALFVLCAAWEHYIELLCEELFNKMLPQVKCDSLERRYKLKLINIVKNHAPDESYCLNLAGEGWKVLLKESMMNEIDKFHSPKFLPVKQLISDYIGFDLSSLMRAEDISLVDDLVKNRGEIAHKGGKAYYPTIGEVKNYRDCICTIVMKIDDKLAEHGKITTGKKPWQVISGGSSINMLAQ
jgi:hypothetical protein